MSQGQGLTRRSARDLLRSWWIGLTLLMWLNWTAFVYAGLRARKRLWLGFAAGYFALSAISITFLALDPDDPVDTWREDAGAWIGIFSWGIAFVHALAIRKQFLERLEMIEDPRLDAAEDKLERRELALGLVGQDPVRARELGVGRPDLPEAFDGELVDLNHASVDAIRALPGFDRRLAERVVAIRAEINGFDAIDDLGLFLDLDANQLDRLRGCTVCLPM